LAIALSIATGTETPDGGIDGGVGNGRQLGMILPVKGG